MSCPTSAGKYSAGSSWLDRLRTSKGLPLHHPDLNLDHFLHQATPKGSSSLLIPSIPPEARAQAENSHVDRRSFLSRQSNSKRKITAENGAEQEERIFDVMNMALAELFHMGNIDEHERIRALRYGRNRRKQLNPKACVLHASGIEGERMRPRATSAFSPPSAENSTVGVKKRSAGRAKQGKKRAAACGDGTVDPELAPQSRTEVTVIDTSCSPEWKSEKLIFRKGTIWKVRDKKLWNLSRKKKNLCSKEKLAELSEKNNSKISTSIDEDAHL